MIPKTLKSTLPSIARTTCSLQTMRVAYGRRIEAPQVTFGNEGLCLSSSGLGAKKVGLVPPKSCQG